MSTGEDGTPTRPISRDDRVIITKAEWAEYQRFRAALEEIAGQDFRGNRPVEQTIAYRALHPPE